MQSDLQPLGGLHHVTAITGDAAGNLSFYTQVLGLRLVKKTVNQDDVSAYHLFYADAVANPGTDVTFFDWPWAAPNRPGVPEIGPIRFRVAGGDALDYWETRLTDLNVPHHREDVGLAFTDPEGQRLELVPDAGLPGGEPWSRTSIPPEFQVKGLHGVYVYDSDVPTLKADFLPNFQGDEGLGIKADAQGSYAESGAAPQSALTPVISAIKAAGSSFVYAGSTPQNTILLEREAKLQGVNSVKVWACNSGCYDSSFFQQGGSVVNGTYAQLDDLPFYTEYQDNPALASLVKQVGGTANLNNNAVLSYVMALLFQDAVQKATAHGGTLNRASLFTALKGETSFTAQGIIGPTNVGGHQLSSCDVITQLVNGQWQRVYPAKPGTFDCNSGNTKTIKMNVTL